MQSSSMEVFYYFLIIIIEKTNEFLYRNEYWIFPSVRESPFVIFYCNDYLFMNTYNVQRYFIQDYILQLCIRNSHLLNIEQTHICHWIAVEHGLFKISFHFSYYLRYFFILILKKGREEKRTFNRITRFNYYLRLCKSKCFSFLSNRRLWSFDIIIVQLQNRIFEFRNEIRRKHWFLFPFATNKTCIAMIKVYLLGSLFVRSFSLRCALCTVHTIVNWLIVYKWWSEQEKRFSCRSNAFNSLLIFRCFQNHPKHIVHWFSAMKWSIYSQ